MTTNHRPARAPLAVIGIGNPIAGDDGAGIMVARGLRRVCESGNGVLFYELSGDLLEMADRLEEARRFIFCDAIQGDTPGEIKIITPAAPLPFSASFHQTDIASVMHTLASLHLTVPFPAWEIWGIGIAAPTHFSENLTAPVSQAVTQCVSRLIGRITSILTE